MNNQEMTRREMIRFLGIEVPMVLLAVQVLPNMAGAEEQYTQLSYRISAAKRDGFMGDYSNKSIICSEYRDAEGKAVGTRILEMDEASAKSNIIKEGDIIFRINDQPFIVGSAEDYEKWSKSIVEMIFEKKRITMDIDRDNKHYLISADFE